MIALAQHASFTSPRLRGEVDRRRFSGGGRVRGALDNLALTIIPLTRLASLATLSPQAERGSDRARRAAKGEN